MNDEVCSDSQKLMPYNKMCFSEKVLPRSLLIMASQTKHASPPIFFFLFSCIYIEI